MTFIYQKSPHFLYIRTSKPPIPHTTTTIQKHHTPFDDHPTHRLKLRNRPTGAKRRKEAPSAPPRPQQSGGAAPGGDGDAASGCFAVADDTRVLVHHFWFPFRSSLSSFGASALSSCFRVCWWLFLVRSCFFCFERWVFVRFVGGFIYFGFVFVVDV